METEETRRFERECDRGSEHDVPHQLDAYALVFVPNNELSIIRDIEGSRV
jgi:hypothetical protein